MNTVFKHIKRCFTIYSALFITLFTTRIRGHQNCGPEQLVHCTKPLTILTDSGSGMTIVTSKAELEKICPDLRSALRCIHEYTRMCMSLDRRRHFKKLFHGTQVVVQDLCNNGSFQNEYLTHSPCMKQVSKENEVCFSTYAQAMREIQSQPSAPPTSNPSLSSPAPDNSLLYNKEDGIKNVCCSFQEYMECSTHVTRRTCGASAAEFSRKFLDRMSSSMINMHCSSYGADECHLMSSSATSPYLPALLSKVTTWLSVSTSLLAYRFLLTT